MKRWLIGKDPDAGKDWRQKAKRQTCSSWPPSGGSLGSTPSCTSFCGPCPFPRSSTSLPPSHTCWPTCTVVVMHYGFASVIYLKPKGPQSLEGDTLMGITYMVLTPFLSPIVFRIWNKELKIAVKKTFLGKVYLEKNVIIWEEFLGNS